MISHVAWLPAKHVSSGWGFGPARMTRWIFVFMCLTSIRCLRAAESPERVASPLILISVDGFRWDYTERFTAETPTLRRLRNEGSTTRSLVPVFPSNTFPNHYTIVTGLYPAKHGIINNDFFDPTTGMVFRFTQPSAAKDSRWWGGEPIWATAIKQGRKAATAFWVGSEAEIAGVRPTFWRNFDYKIPFEQRLEELIGWMKLPFNERPALVAFYLEETNAAGHRYGPDSPEVAAAVKLSDDRISIMLARLRAESIEPNLVIVSDHGMSSTSVDRVIFLEDYVERGAVQVDADGSLAALRPLRGSAADLVRAFQNVRHAKAYRAEDLPAHFHFAANARISPVWIIPDEGWHVVTRTTFERLRANYRANGYLQGDHGYDPALPNMHGILIAHGPAFRRGVHHESVENIHVYNLLCAVLGLKPSPNDGDDRLVKALLRE
jgi:predicted AlkP superfamily pyrophosphatase or phosphodiesterase